MSRRPPKNLREKLADVLERLIGGLAQPLHPAPAPVPVPVRRPGAYPSPRIRR
ncbi:MAG: hypothetical protein U0031_05695 [Thermomicrobiales bacterium]